MSLHVLLVILFVLVFRRVPRLLHILLIPICVMLIMIAIREFHVFLGAVFIRTARTFIDIRVAEQLWLLIMGYQFVLTDLHSFPGVLLAAFSCALLPTFADLPGEVALKLRFNEPLPMKPCGEVTSKPVMVMKIKLMARCTR